MVSAAIRLCALPSFLVLFAACSADRGLGPEAGDIAASLSADAPSGLSATASSHSQIDLVWQDNTNNESGFEVHRSTTGAGGVFTLLATTAPGVTGHSDAGLTAATQYCYKVRAFKTNGRRRTLSTFSETDCATTLDPPPPPVPGPVITSLKPIYSYGVQLAWSYDQANSGFILERSSSSTGPWTFIGTTLIGYTSYSESATAEVQRCYRMFAIVDGKYSAPSNVRCTVPPAAPALTGTQADQSTIDLAWTDNSAFEDGYEIRRAGANGVWPVIADLPPNSTSYRDAGLTADTAYFYQVYAKRDGGFSSRSNTVRIVITSSVPGAPVNAAAVPANSSSIAVSWQAGSENTDGYRVERSTDAGASWSTAVTTLWYQTDFLDEGLTAERELCYRVVATNAIGESPPSGPDCTAPPAAPTDLVATTADGLAIDLTWRDISGVEEGYLVQRQLTGYYGPAEYLTIATLGPNATSYRDTGLGPSEFHFYRVIAVKDGGSSDPSNEAGAWSDGFPAPSNLTATAVSSQRIDLAWVDNSSNETHFVVYRCTGDAAACISGSWVQLAWVGANTTTYSDAGLQAATTYTYRVWAYNDAFWRYSDASSYATATTQALQP